MAALSGTRIVAPAFMLKGAGMWRKGRPREFQYVESSRRGGEWTNLEMKLSRRAPVVDPKGEVHSTPAAPSLHTFSTPHPHTNLEVELSGCALVVDPGLRYIAHQRPPVGVAHF